MTSCPCFTRSGQGVKTEWGWGASWATAASDPATSAAPQHPPIRTDCCRNSLRSITFMVGAPFNLKWRSSDSVLEYSSTVPTTMIGANRRPKLSAPSAQFSDPGIAVPGHEPSIHPALNIKDSIGFVDFFDGPRTRQTDFRSVARDYICTRFLSMQSTLDEQMHQYFELDIRRLR